MHLNRQKAVEPSVSADGGWLTTLPRDRQQELLARHAAFWRRDPGSRALIGFLLPGQKFPLQNLKIKHEGLLTPADITSAFIQADADYHPPVITGDDLFPAKTPLASVPWSEGYSGARVILSSRVAAAWSAPQERIPQCVEDLEAQLQPAWLDKLVEAIETNASAAGTRLLVSEAILRGPSDCLEAVLGTEQLYLWCYDRPEVVAAMLDRLADVLIRLHRSQLDVLPRFHGGTINRYRLWGPGENVITGADTAVGLSPGQFRDLFVPAYRKLAQSFDAVSIHFHSSAHWHAEALLEVEGLAAIEWGIDPSGPALADLLPVFARILERKCLILKNVETEADVRMLVDRLPQEGLCIIAKKTG